MTEAQAEQLAKVKGILSEHFDSYILMVGTPNEEDPKMIHGRIFFDGKTRTLFTLVDLLITDFKARF